MPTQYPPITPSSYVSPLPYGNFTFVSAHTIFPYEQSAATLNMANEYTQEVMGPLGELLFKNTYKIINNAYEQSQTEGSDIGTTISLGSGAYTVKYTYKITSQVPATTLAYQQIEATYTFETAPNQYPLKKWTITDVINRLLDIAEPIRRGEEPRFKLNAEQAVLFDKILAPQMSFTKNTLRECLKQCGEVVHGEPRLDVVQDANGAYSYEISFDMFGRMDKSGIYTSRYVTKAVSQAIENYASSLDSNVDNLVNALSRYNNVIVEPYENGYKTVRTETMYARITDANMIIATQYPIYTVSELVCGYIDGNGEISPGIDLMPYLYESSLYNSQLSSYSGEYPWSKAYGLMYTQGQKNITALNFKQEDPIEQAFENYSIVNILSRVIGRNITISDYPLLAFRIKYTPIYSSRVSQTKVNFADYPYGAALVYNQQANIVEAQYYGENLKGAIARLGNVEKTITYNLTRLSQIPKAGQLFDDDYYISAVYVEYLASVIRCTIGLSKDFNRLSQYIGISSVKRFYEVSETQAVERNTLWKEYVVIGDSVASDTDCYIGGTFMAALAATFTQPASRSPLTSVAAWGGTYDAPTFSETEQTIPETDVDISYSNDDFTVTVTLKKEYAGRKLIVLQMDYDAVGAAGESNGMSLRFSGQTITVNADDYTPAGGELRNINAVTFMSGETTILSYPLPLVVLPVVASAFGNSIAFSWTYEDNYSAGAYSQYASGGTGDAKVEGYFQNTFRYADYYGKMYYYNFRLKAYDLEPSNFEEQTEIGTRLPGGDQDAEPNGQSNISTEDAQPILLRKDNREKLQCNFQVDMVANRKGMIIGSALAAYCPAVRGADPSLKARLYIFDEPLNKFINHVEGTVDVDLSTVPNQPITVSDVNNLQFSVTAAAFAASGKSWAIVTAQTDQSEIVEDEKGNVTPQPVQYGGDVLLAQNMDISAGQAFTPIYFTAKRKIFKEDVWIANK